MRYSFALLIPLAFCVATTLAQDSDGGPGSGPNGLSGSMHFGAPMSFAMHPVTGAPYSSEEVFEQVQTLEDGTHITHNSDPTKVDRDSLGRTRTERSLFAWPIVTQHPSGLPVIVEITDPAARVKYTLDTVNKVAHRQQLPPAADTAKRALGVNRPMGAIVVGGSLAGSVSEGTVSPPATRPQRPPPQISHENLGTQTIEGVLVEGSKITTVWPVGSQGNDQPISAVAETWMSPDLKIVILSIINDPRFGIQTKKLTNITRSEPPADLFQPPPNYTLVDETGDFTIKWGTRQ